MSKFASVFLLAVALMALVHHGSALKCYQCDPSEKCNTFDDIKSSNCSAGNDKECFIVGDEENYVWARGCTGLDDFCKKVTDANSTMACSTCTDDECNSGNYLLGSFMLSIILASIVNMIR